jgi:hypothetical protein
MRCFKSKNFQLSRTKTEHMECKFSKNRYKNGQEISESKRFRYLGSIIYKD